MFASLIVLLLLAFIVWFWLSSIRVRELAVQIARDMCKARGWQLLDESVALKKVSLRRGDDGRMHICRHYAFEYTLEDNRRHDKRIIMCGQKALHQTEEKSESNVIQFPKNRGK